MVSPLRRPELAQGVDDLVGPAEQLARLELGAVGGHQGQVAGLLLCHRPESEVGHRRSSLGVPVTSHPAMDQPARRRLSTLGGLGAFWCAPHGNLPRHVVRGPTRD